MSDDEWFAIPLTWVDATTLVPAQDCLTIDRLAALLQGEPPLGNDPYPRIVRCNGRLYTHNGNHRVIIGILHGQLIIQVRVKDFLPLDKPEKI